MKKLLVIFVLVLSVLFVFSISYADSTWSEWQDEVIEATDGIKVETQQVPSSYKMVVYVCTDNNSPSLRSYYNYRNGTLRAKWEDEWTVETFNSAQKIPNGTYWDYANNVAGYIRSGDAYTLDYMPYYVEKINYKTQYRFKKIQKQTEQKINNNVGDNIVRKTTEAIEAGNNQYYEVEQETTKKKKKKSTGKKMNGGAKVWTGTSDNQNQVSENTANSIIENDNFIVMDEVVNGVNVTTIIPDMSKIQYSPIDGIFNQSSYNDYNKEVALFAAELSQKAYNKGWPFTFTGSFPSELVSTLENQYGFSKVKTYNYTTSDTLNGSYINANCFAIGHRILIDNSVILCIVARGSNNIGEFIADAYNLEGTTNVLNLYVFNDIYNFSKQIGIGVNKYFEINPELKNVKSMKVLITGHSLGGAAANLFGAMFLNDVVNGNCLNKCIKTSDVFTYTFGAIKVIECNTNTNMESGYENIYNIYNYYDSFGPNGAEGNLSASSPYQKFGKTLMYQDDRFHYDESSFNLFNNPNHDMDNYIDALNNYDFTRTNNSAQNAIISNNDTTNNNNSINNNNNNSNNSNNNNNNNNHTINNNYDSIIDLTSLFNGRLVKIFSKETNHYISDEEGTIHADGEGGEGVFITQTTSDGWVGFKRVNGNWLSVQDQGYIRAEGQNLSSWECFKVYQYKDNMYLLSQKEGKFVQVINDGDQITNPLCATRSVNEGLDNAFWERFDIYFVDGK